MWLGISFSLPSTAGCYLTSQTQCSILLLSKQNTGATFVIKHKPVIPIDLLHIKLSMISVQDSKFRSLRQTCMVMGICFSIWPLGNGCSIWQKRKWCDRAFSPSAFKNSNGETAASAYGNAQMLRHPLVLQLLNPIQNYNSGWWFSSFRLHVIWPLIAMNVAEPVKCLDIPVHLCRNKFSKNAQMRPIAESYQTRPKQTRIKIWCLETAHYSDIWTDIL